MAPGGQTSRAEHAGERAPVDVDAGGHIESGPKPNTVLGSHKVPESYRRPPSAGEGMYAPPATPVQPGVPNTLLAVLMGASIVDEHHALMGAVIEKI